MLDELQITMLSLIVGAFFGVLRTWQTHGLRLIQPTFTVRDRTIRVKLGWIASVLLGAGISWASVSGYLVFFYETIPDTPTGVIMVSMMAGYGSLDLLNRLTGKEIVDIDAHEFAMAYGEVNLQKALMIGTMLKDVECVERIQIRDGEYGGVVNVFVVPKPGHDTEECRKIVENYMAKHRPVGVQFYVVSAHEVNIDIDLNVILLTVEDDNSSDWYKKEIADRITTYINSLMPGEWIRKNKMITRAIQGFTYVTDIPDDRVISDPPFEENSYIKIDRNYVARAGKIAVQIVETSLY